MGGEKAQLLVDFVLRMAISLALPVWGAVMIRAGRRVAFDVVGRLRRRGIWVGLLLAVGNPLAEHALREL